MPYISTGTKETSTQGEMHCALGWMLATRFVLALPSSPPTYCIPHYHSIYTSSHHPPTVPLTTTVYTPSPPTYCTLTTTVHPHHPHSILTLLPHPPTHHAPTSTLTHHAQCNHTPYTHHTHPKSHPIPHHTPQLLPATLPHLMPPPPHTPKGKEITKT